MPKGGLCPCQQGYGRVPAGPYYKYEVPEFADKTAFRVEKTLE